jgi:hypothetical protein
LAIVQGDSGIQSRDQEEKGGPAAAESGAGAGEAPTPVAAARPGTEAPRSPASTSRRVEKERRDRVPREKQRRDQGVGAECSPDTN